jgi:tetratricopeptide (TPR) repeat protein
MIMKNFFILATLLFFTVAAIGQEERKIIRSGNKAYSEKKYTEAEELYRKALEKKPQSLEANYNIGNVLYKQNKYLDAASKYNSLTNSTDDKREKAYIYHNMGNSYLKANKLNESINAYKESLKLNPGDRETKFNLAYAQRMLVQQQQQQQQQQNKDNKDQNKKDDKKKDQQNKDQQEKDKKDDQKDQQQQNKNISQEDANRILEAMQNEEKELQKKLKMEKVQAQRGKTLKNW